MSHEDTSSETTSMLLTFLAGVAVGAVVTALVTPQSGPETRKDLRDLGRRTKERAQAITGKVGEALVKTKAATLQTMDDLKRGIRETAQGSRT